jgi:hypothetical protein
VRADLESRGKQHEQTEEDQIAPGQAGQSFHDFVCG